MIEGSQYAETVRNYFAFLTTEFAFKQQPVKIKGNAYYDVQYKDKTRIVSISYENIEDCLLVTIYMLEKDGCLPDYDDKTRTLHLNKLNEAILTFVDQSEINFNHEYFKKFQAKNVTEKKLLKSAKELRLCLIHFSDLQKL